MPSSIYIGTHGDKGAHRADVILPGAAYTEKVRHFSSTPKARVQHGQSRGLRAPATRRRTGAILRALSDVLGKNGCPFDSLAAQLRRASWYGGVSAFRRRSTTLQRVAPLDLERAISRLWAAKSVEQGRLHVARSKDFLSDEPDRAGVGCDGRVLVAGQGRLAAGSRVGQGRWKTFSSFICAAGADHSC